MKQKNKFKQTEIGLIPEDWEVKKLGQVLEIKYGKDHKKLTEGNIPCYGSGGIMRYVNQSISNDESVLIPRKGSLNNIYYLNKPFWTVDTIFWTKINHKLIVPKFLFYKLKLYDFVSGNLGSAVPSMTVSFLNEIKVPLPPLPEQSAIAKILSDLDSKIELLQKQNETLEKIGQAIFKHWFVDFEFPNEEGKPYKSSGGKMVESELGEIPEGWSVGKLGDIIDKTNKSVKAGEGLKGRKYVPIDKLPMKKLSFDDYLPYNEAKSSLISFEKNDILLGAMRVYFHRVNISPFAGVTRTTTFVLRPKESHLLEFSLFLLHQDSTIDFANQNSRGSTMPYAVWKNSLENMPIIIPDGKILSDFSILLNSTIKRIRDSIFELRNLQKTRDLFLPKLMTGKIRVKIK